MAFIYNANAQEQMLPTQKEYRNGDAESLLPDPEVRNFLRKRLRDRSWGDTWIGSFVLGFLGATDDGVFNVISMYLALYLAVAIMWMMFLQIESVNDQIRKQDFTGAFSPITFIIAFITRDMIANSTNSTTVTSKLYVTLLHQIRDLAGLVSGTKVSIIATPPGKYFAKLGDTPEAEETKQNALGHVENIRQMLMVLARWSYRLFTTVDEVDDHKAYDFQKYEVLSEFAYGQYRMPGDDASLIMHGCLLLLTREIQHMNERDILSTGVFLRAHELITKIGDTVQDIWTNQNIRPPAIFAQVFDAILKFYLYVMVPLQVNSTTNRFWLILIYPLVVLIYTVPVILGDWLRSPFSPYSRWKGPPLQAYRNILYRRIEYLLGDPAHTRNQILKPRLRAPLDPGMGVSTLLT